MMCYFGAIIIFASYLTVPVCKVQKIIHRWIDFYQGWFWTSV